MFQHGIGIYIIHVDILVFRKFVLKVKIVKRNVIYTVLLRFWGLAEGSQKLLIFVISYVSDIMHVEALFSAVLAIPSHIKPTDKLLL